GLGVGLVCGWLVVGVVLGVWVVGLGGFVCGGGGVGGLVGVCWVGFGGCGIWFFWRCVVWVVWVGLGVGLGVGGVLFGGVVFVGGGWFGVLGVGVGVGLFGVCGVVVFFVFLFCFLVGCVCCVYEFVCWFWIEEAYWTLTFSCGVSRGGTN
ncbi:hypothetical protein RA264_27790, partial [Pseudomonas syringae pv. tagetis]